MTPDQILRELSKQHDDPPALALQAALEQRAEVAPLLLAELDRLVKAFDEALLNSKNERQYTSLGKKLIRNPSPLFYGFLLAAEWKQTDSYPLYIDLLRCPFADAPNLLASIVHNDLGARVMAEIYNGDPGPLFSFLLDDTSSESVRLWQWRTLILLVKRGALNLETLRPFLVRAFHELDNEEEQYVLQGWETVIVYLGLDDLVPLVEQGHEDLRFPGGTVEEFREKYAYARAHPDEPIDDDPIVPFKGLFDEVEWAVANRAE